VGNSLISYTKCYFTNLKLKFLKLILVVMMFVLYTPIYIEYADPCVGMKTKICLMFNDAVFSVSGKLLIW
jgi:hypothetical protein